MTATPDSFSAADLAKLLENAPQDITDCAPEPEDRKLRLVELAQDLLAEGIKDLDGCDAAQLHKIILHILTDHMIEWHSSVSAHAIHDGEHKAAIGWARDAGKFQAIWNILATISVDHDDFTCEVE